MAKQVPQGSVRRTARPPLEEDVGPRLRAHREQRGLSLRELARRLGVSPSAISQIETGKSRPSVSTLYSIVSELGMSLDELFGAPKPAPPAAPPTPATPAPRPPSGQKQAERHVERADSRATIELESGVRWERLTRARTTTWTSSSSPTTSADPRAKATGRSATRATSTG